MEYEAVTMSSTEKVHSRAEALSGIMPVPGHILRIREDVFDHPVFVLTADIDWASDYCIHTLATFAHERGITPTLFVTHDSPALHALRAERFIECGIHPNFLPGSTHGAEPAAVIAHLLSIVPEPVATRCHHYLDGSEIAHSLVANGLRLDSNSCLFLQEAIRPQFHCSGLIRLPCFWEDDVHWERGFSWCFAQLRKASLTPGLKLLNIHPFMFTLNIPDAAFYARHKHHITTLDAVDASRLCHPGLGPATFLAEMMDTIHKEGFHFTTLSALVDELNIEWVEP